MVWLTVSRRSLVAALFACCGVFPVLAQVWQPMGPSGGDVRTLAADPDDARRLFLGTADGHIFGSTDAGDHWAILGRAGSRLDSVVTAIVVDPRDAKSVLAATWTQDPAAGGAIYHSSDGGKTWSDSGLAGHAIRALAAAPSNPDILVAAAVDGAYRSADAGRTWQRISPQGNQELRNLDSVAIDPKHPDVIYVGTYHLPWKTSDAGKKWTPIHEGMIDDSDVMSIIVDRTNPRRVYASAAPPAGERFRAFRIRRAAHRRFCRIRWRPPLFTPRPPKAFGRLLARARIGRGSLRKIGSSARY